MNMMTIPLVWGVAAGGVLGVAVAWLMWRSRSRSRNAASAEGMDQWERQEERLRRRDMVYSAASYILLFVSAAVAAALSFHGLVGFGRNNLGLTGGWEYLVPFGLDGAAMFCSVLAVREANQGEAALSSRVLVWTFAGTSAWFNWVHAPAGPANAGAPQFFAGMSLAAAVLFDRALKQTRRAALREKRLVAKPLPHIRMARWLRAPRETFDSWSLMLLEDVRSLDEAVEQVRTDKQTKTAAKARARMLRRHQRAKSKTPEAVGGTIERVPLPAGSGDVEPTARGALDSSQPARELPPRRRPDPLAPARGSDNSTRSASARTSELQTLEQELKALKEQFK